MSARDALQLDRIDDHQTLRQAGKIRRREPGMAVIFVSHQWLGKAHPDPEMKQFWVFQEALQRLADGMRVKVCPSTSLFFKQKEPKLTPAQARSLLDAYIWYDFFGVPQITTRDVSQKLSCDLQDAVDSIPAYVQLSDWFFILAPFETHVDSGRMCSLETWSNRGWCRVELAAHVLATRTEHFVICITKPDFVVENFPFAWLHLPATSGDFAVESDRPKVAKLVGDMLQERVRYLGTTDNVFEFRFMKAMEQHSEAAGSQEDNLDRWLEAFHFVGQLADDPAGWSPIHFASLQANTVVLDFMLAGGLSVDQQTSGSSPRFSAYAGMTPLMIAMSYIPEGTTAIRMAEFLLSKGASLQAASEDGNTVLHYAAAGACDDPAIIRMLVASGASMTPTNWQGETPALMAGKWCPGQSKFPKHESVKTLLNERADVNVVNSTPLASTLLKYASALGQPEQVRMLLEYRADVNQGFVGERMPSKVQAVVPETYMEELVEKLGGGTPLHWTSMFGNDQATAVLLAGNAKTNAHNAAGSTAKHIALEYNNEDVSGRLVTS